MIDFLLRTVVPQFSDLAVTVHSGDTYTGTVTETGFSPFFEDWIKMFRKTHFWVRSGIGAFTEVDEAVSLAACVATAETFFYDGDEVTGGTLYIHMPSTATVGSFITCADERGFSLKEAQELDGVAYDPRIMKAVPLVIEADSRKIGKMTFKDQKVLLANPDTVLDTFIRQPIPGTEATLILFDDQVPDSLRFYTGVIQGDTSTIIDTQFNLLDKRRDENAPAPSEYFNSTDFASAPENTLDKLIPDGYGPLKGIKAYPIDNGVTFKYAQAATTLSAVYYKDDDSWVSTTFTATDTANGIFTTTNGKNSSGNIREIRVDATLRSAVNPGDIIKDLVLRYQGISYDADHYDLTEWAAEAAKLADVALYMDKEKDLYTWIEKLQGGSDYLFIYQITGEGKRTLRVADIDRTPAGTIQFYKNKDVKLQISRNYSEVSALMRVNYDEDRRLETWQSYIDDTRQEYVNRRYGTNVQESEDSLLTSAADAQTRAEKFMDDRSDVRPTGTVQVHVDSLDLLEYKIFDVIFAEFVRPQYVVTVPGGGAGDIIIDAGDSETFTIDVTASDSFTIGEPLADQIVLDSGRLYWGTVLGIITRINYDPNTSTYSLTIRQIPDQA